MFPVHGAMMTLPFAKLETYDTIGQVLAVLEETESGDPCVSLRVSAQSPGFVVRIEYTFSKAHDPDAEADRFFQSLTRADMEQMGTTLFEQGRTLLAQGEH